MKVTSFDVLATPYIGEDQATAEVITDNHSMWLKFVFTDDEPNLNSQGVAEDEFENLIKTGAHKPFKKALGSLAEDHANAVPIGTIAAMRQEGNQIVAIASIWQEEFPEEAELIRTAYAAKQKLGVSWEIFYKDTEVDDKGTSWLKECSTRAATLVGNPAYGNRTPILAVAAVWTTAYMNNLPDSAFLYVEPGGKKDAEGKTTPRSLRHFPYKDDKGNVDLAHLRNALARIPDSGIPESEKSRLTKKAQGILAKHNKGESSMDEDKELETIRAEKDALIQEKASMHDELETLRKEVEELRGYKESREAADAKAALTKKRLSQFSEAGIEISADSFEAEADRWLGLDDAAFEFVLKQLVNSKPPKTSQSSASVIDEEEELTDPKALVRKLLASRKQSNEEK
jgi:hypothetical protein